MTIWIKKKHAWCLTNKNYVIKRTVVRMGNCGIMASRRKSIIMCAAEGHHPVINSTYFRRSCSRQRRSAEGLLFYIRWCGWVKFDGKRTYGVHAAAVRYIYPVYIDPYYAGHWTSTSAHTLSPRYLPTVYSSSFSSSSFGTI